jgi:CRISPR-associated protein Csm2
MKKKCEKCGKEFEAYQPHFKLCPNCYSPEKKTVLSAELLLKSYYNSEGNLLKEVFIEIPQSLANIFDKDGLGTKQLRDFHRRILNARIKATLKGISSAKPFLHKCLPDMEYQHKRGIIPESFIQFMKHHLKLAEKDEKALEGFYQHFDSIVCYFPSKKEKGGTK